MIGASEFVRNQRNELRIVDIDASVVGSPSAHPIAAVDAEFMRVVINFEFVQQIDSEAPENLDLALQLIFGNSSSPMRTLRSNSMMTLIRSIAASSPSTRRS